MRIIRDNRAALVPPRAKRSAMPERYGSAIVIGASMTGLLVARALSAHFDRVMVVERDVLPGTPEVRKGVPQAAHAHGLLASGYRVMDDYFPGLMDDLEASGAPRGDVAGDFIWFQYGRWKLRRPVGCRGITVSRPCLETAIRRRVEALPNVAFLEGTAAVKPLFDANANRVTGLVVRRRDADRETTVAADLVVDASGRGSQSAKRLDEWGFGQPVTLTVQVDVGYATRVFERRPGDFFNSMGGIVSGTPASTRLAAVLAAEHNRWVVTLGGMLGEHPPTDEAAWIQFATGLPVPVVYDLITTARPLTDITTYRFPANQRRLYERMTRFPAGYLVMGDAVCSFNPIYGQGMSVAAMEAKALEEALTTGLDGVARRFYARSRTIVDIPWTIATGEDLRFPQVQGTRPPGFHLVNRYLERVHAIASEDPMVCRKFFDVLNLLAPPTSLMRPHVVWRVLARSVPRGPGSPWGSLSPGSGSVIGTDAATHTPV
jgi:2-polyprenyl-6-methoxyphenol hydroxylase-like FAD-dependent oxidoreductase